MIPVEFKNRAMGTAAECTKCHVLPSVELKRNLFGGRVNSQQPVSVCLFTLLDASIDRHFALSVQFWVSWKYLERDFIWITYTLDVCHM